METTNTMAENMPVVAQPTNPEPSVPTLADVIGVESGKQEEVNTNNENAIPQQEPGWYAKRRQRDRAEWEAEHQAEMTEIRNQMAQLQEYRIGVEADKLLASGKITDRDMAIEYLRSKEGLPSVPTTSAVPPRDERGRFVSPNQQTTNESAVQQRASELYAQAKTLQKFSGVDVLGVYRSNPEYMERVNRGEWDMADVLKASQSNPVAQPEYAPAPVRASNGNGIGSVSFRNMTAEQFAKVNESLSRGGKIDMR